MAINTFPVFTDDLPPPGTPGGDAARLAFAATLGNIIGSGVSLWLPATTDTTASTSVLRDARVFTHDATIAARIGAQGSGVSVTFNGTDGEADTPDTADLSFGNASVDAPFSIFAWVNQTATAGIKAIFSKYDAAGVLREYQLVLDAAEKLRLQLYDESADTYIGRVSASALATGSVLFVAGVYDGRAATAGIKLYSAAALLSDADESSGSYVAMENTATVGRIFSSGSGTPVEYFSGTGYCVGICAGELHLDQLWDMKQAGNAFYGLTI